MWNIYDFINTQVTYNQTYTYRLPSSYLDQAHALADYHEDGVFSDADANGIGNVAGRTLLPTVLSALERIAFNDDPLQLMVVQTTYQPFISFFHITDMVKEHPELQGIPNFGAALAIELRRGSPPDMRDFLRFKFKNGTADPEDWLVIHPFGQCADIPLTEFIYRAEGSAITSNKQWAQVCGVSPALNAGGVVRRAYVTNPGLPTTAIEIASSRGAQVAFGSILFFAGFVIANLLVRVRQARTGRHAGVSKDYVETGRI